MEERRYIDPIRDEDTGEVGGLSAQGKQEEYE